MVQCTQSYEEHILLIQSDYGKSVTLQIHVPMQRMAVIQLEAQTKVEEEEKEEDPRKQMKNKTQWLTINRTPSNLQYCLLKIN